MSEILLSACVPTPFQGYHMSLIAGADVCLKLLRHLDMCPKHLPWSMLWCSLEMLHIV